MMNLTILNYIRTNNFNDENVMQKIMEMWQNTSDYLSDHKGDTYGLYYAYESDYKGDYTLGVAIKKESDSSITIPADTKFEIYKVDADDEQGIINMWNDIWNKEEEGKLNRAYTYDFEKYYPDGNIDIYIAVNEKHPL